MEEIKLEKNSDGTYSMTINRDGKTVKKPRLTMQQVIYELEMRAYTNGYDSGE